MKVVGKRSAGAEEGSAKKQFSELTAACQRPLEHRPYKRIRVLPQEPVVSGPGGGSAESAFTRVMPSKFKIKESTEIELVGNPRDAFAHCVLKSSSALTGLGTRAGDSTGAQLSLRHGHQTKDEARHPIYRGTSSTAASTYDHPPTHGATRPGGATSGFNSYRGSCTSSSASHHPPQQHTRDSPSTKSISTFASVSPSTGSHDRDGRGPSACSSSRTVPLSPVTGQHIAEDTSDTKQESLRESFLDHFGNNLVYNGADAIDELRSDLVVRNSPATYLSLQCASGPPTKGERDAPKNPPRCLSLTGGETNCGVLPCKRRRLRGKQPAPD